MVGRVHGQADQRLHAAQAGRARHHAQAVVEALGGGKAAAQDEGDHPAERRHLAPRHPVPRVCGQARVDDARHLGVVLEVHGERQRVLALPRDAQVKGLEAAQHQERRVWIEDPAQDLQQVAHALHPRAAAQEGAAHDVAVAAQGLGEAVHDDVRPQPQRALEEGRGEGVVHHDGQAGRMCLARNGLDVDDLDRGVRGALEHDQAAARAGHVAEAQEIGGRDDAAGHSPLREQVAHELRRAPVERRAGQDLVARF